MIYIYHQNKNYDILISFEFYGCSLDQDNALIARKGSTKPGEWRYLEISKTYAMQRTIIGKIYSDTIMEIVRHE